MLWIEMSWKRKFLADCFDQALHNVGTGPTKRLLHHLFCWRWEEQCRVGLPGPMRGTGSASACPAAQFCLSPGLPLPPKAALLSHLLHRSNIYCRQQYSGSSGVLRFCANGAGPSTSSGRCSSVPLQHICDIFCRWYWSIAGKKGNRKGPKFSMSYFPESLYRIAGLVAQKRPERTSVSDQVKKAYTR